MYIYVYTKRPIKKPVRRPIKRPTKRPIKRPIKRPTKRPMRTVEASQEAVIKQGHAQTQRSWQRCKVCAYERTVKS